MIRRPAPLLALLGLFVSACATLEEEPWARSSAGHHQLSLLTGTTAYRADVDATGLDGPLTGLSDSDETTLDPKFGVQGEYVYHVTDAIGLGAGAGARIFDPTGLELFGAGMDAHEFTSTHLFLLSRYYLPAFGEEQRWRPYLGLDLGYVPDVSFDATIDYGGGFTEEFHYDGDSYWSLGFRGAIACLLTDALSLELGTFYELPLDTSDAIFTANVPGAGPSDVAGEVSPSGFVFFLALSWHL